MASLASTKSLKSATLPTKADMNRMNKEDEDALMSKIKTQSNSSSSSGLQLSQQEVFTLQTLLANLPTTTTASTEIAQQKRHSVHAGQNSSHFDLHNSMKRARSDISDDLEEESVDHVFSLFHNHQTLRHHTSLTPMKRWQSATQKVIKRNRAANHLMLHGADRSFYLKDTKEFQNDYTKSKSVLAVGIIFKLCNILEKDVQTMLKDSLSTLDKWGKFNIFDIYHQMKENREKTVSLVSLSILAASTSLLQNLRVKPMVVTRYVEAVCDTYCKDISYHTSLHGVDVMQGLHSLLSHRSDTGVILEADHDRNLTMTNEVMYGALLAALVHDLGHPGLTNRFMVRTNNEFAIKYNDISVLENMHVFVALSLTKRAGCDVFATFSEETKRDTRHLWISMILETDMSNHMSGVWGLQRRLRSHSTGPCESENDFAAFDNKNYVSTLSLLLHACDLSNPTKPWSTYRQWTDLVMEEFFQQSSKEQELAIPITLPLRETCVLDQFQIGFIRFIRPFFVTLNNISNVSMQEQINNLNNNERKWQEIKEIRAQATDKETKQASSTTT
jgi:calcium/calmodulin-dependent 3',5'-cyclic nucleotide phosphodiesterase